MKTKLLMILSVALFTFTAFTDQSFALCAEEINYDAKLKLSELVFTGTVTRLDNYDGPQRVTFFIHDVIKGEVDTPKHVLENTRKIFYENDSVTSSSNDVDYKIGKTYKVYVENGETSRCTTEQIIPPTSYIWEPGPEDGNYYAEKEEIPLRQYQDANERPQYVDALSSGSVVLPDKSQKLSDRELDDMMDGLFSHGLDHNELPIASIAIDYERDILVLWTPDLTIGNKIQELIGDMPFVLLYEESPARWEHDGPSPEPIPEPGQEKIGYENCGPGTTLEDGICVVNSDNENTEAGVKWGDPFYEKLPSPNLEPIRDYDYEFIYVLVLVTVVIVGGTAGGIIFAIRRKRK
ncbi:hypothetical protein [Nitrosopumilus sp. b2]|uniref:hypothetical protein n=1 Tax=Nitrosopumilus sp. b2 TaxID=2109908 RepID=UPI0015F6CEF8|nr:hypothetical protein [Nitrosopumilus sp. b2]